jgi:hypothetical protein
MNMLKGLVWKNVQCPGFGVYGFKDSGIQRFKD